MFFSIVIPVYNVGAYLPKCLDSILAQTYKNFELIIIDDGSEDETAKVCDEYAAADERIQVVHKKNEGVSAARNTGIKMVKGEYILFFDGDDFVEPYCLSELNQIVEEGEYDTVIYGYHRFENGRVKETTLPGFSKDIYQGPDIMKEVFPKFIGLSYDNINAWIMGEKGTLTVENPALWRSMVSTRLIKENNLLFNTTLKVGEDTLFISEYLSYAESVYIQRKCYYYLVTRETSTIFVYEKKPLAKLEGKINQLTARKQLTDRIEKRLNMDITSEWSGTVVMSVIEMAFLMSDKIKGYSYGKRYSLFMRYAGIIKVREILRNFRLKKKTSVKAVPFILAKAGCYRTLFLAVTILHLVNYEFKR